MVAEDEEPFKVDFEKLKQLRPAFTKEGTVTAGNASSISDGAAMTLLASESALKKHNLVPKARLAAYSTNSLAPDLFPDAPVGAIESACARAGIKVTDVDLFEVNEAFAVVSMIAAVFSVTGFSLEARRLADLRQRIAVMTTQLDKLRQKQCILAVSAGGINHKISGSDTLPEEKVRQWNSAVESVQIHDYPFLLTGI